MIKQDAPGFMPPVHLVEVELHVPATKGCRLHGQCSLLGGTLNIHSQRLTGPIYNPYITPSIPIVSIFFSMNPILGGRGG